MPLGGEDVNPSAMERSTLNGGSADGNDSVAVHLDHRSAPGNERRGKARHEERRAEEQ